MEHDDPEPAYEAQYSDWANVRMASGLHSNGTSTSASFAGSSGRTEAMATACKGSRRLLSS